MIFRVAIRIDTEIDCKVVVLCLLKSAWNFWETSREIKSIPIKVESNRISFWYVSDFAL